MDEKRLKKISKEKLEKFCESKVKTTMIGAIAAIEQSLGDKLDDPEWQIWLSKVRDLILDKGNNQIRSLHSELLNYDVEWLKGYIEFRRKV